MLQVLDAAALLRWCGAARDALAAARQEIDDLNVFPVPDGDTGTNLLLTAEAVAAAALTAPQGAAATAEALHTAALTGARGNSGVLLSQLLRGLTDALAADGRLDGPATARALRRGAELARAAVARPVEGTMLTVAHDSAEAACAAGGTLEEVLTAACRGARDSLARTPDLLPALRDAGVVDAGGRGLVVLLEALLAVVQERAPDPAPHLAARPDRRAMVAAREMGSPDYGFEVQLLLHGADEPAMARLTGRLGTLGDSLVVVGAEGLHNVHVHVNDVAAALAAAADAGDPTQVTVTRFSDQQAPEGGRGVVAVVQGAGLRALFAAAGAVVVETASPSAGELLEAVRRTGAAVVVLLPNHSRLRAVADAAAAQARAQGQAVHVVATGSPLQGLAALAVADPLVSLEADLSGMAAAAAGTRWAEVVTAVRQATTTAGPCLPGDALGVEAGTVVVVGVEPGWVARRLLDRLGPGSELLTVVHGDRAAAVAVAAYAQERFPGLEVQVVDGGQPHAALLLGAE